MFHGGCGTNPALISKGLRLQAGGKIVCQSGNQPSPDFKGIKTQGIAQGPRLPRTNPALISKGLRLVKKKGSDGAGEPTQP